MPLYLRLPLYLCPYTPASRPAFSSVNDIQYATPHPLLCLRVRRALVSAWHVCVPSTQVLFGLIIRHTTYTNHSDSRTPVIPDLSTPNAVNLTIHCPIKPPPASSLSHNSESSYQTLNIFHEHSNTQKRRWTGISGSRPPQAGRALYAQPECLARDCLHSTYIYAYV